MRQLSPQATQAVHAEETPEVFLTLLTFTHPSLPAPVRVVDNHSDITSRGMSFVGYPFEVILPGEDPSRPQTATVRIDGVDRQIVALLRELDSSPSVTVEIILASSPDVVEVAFEDLSLASADWDATTITAELAYEDVLNEPFPGDSFTPANHPGLF